MIQIIKSKEQLGTLLHIYNNSDNIKHCVDQLNIAFNSNYELGEWIEFIEYAKQFNKIFKLDKTYQDKLNIDTQITRVKNNVVRAQTNRSITSVGRTEYLGDVVSDILKKNFKLEQVKPTKSTLKSEKLTYVFLSDFHYRNEKDNEYINKVFNSVYNETSGNIHLILMGDLVQGNLRITDILNGDSDIIAQVLSVSNLILNNIDIKRIKKVSILKGNHDEIRLNSMKGNYGVSNPNLCYIASEMINAKYKSLSNVYDELDIVSGKQQFHIIHGHQFKGENKLRQYASYTPDVITIHAHYHHYYVDNNTIGLPALCDPNDYEKSLGIKAGSKGYFIIKDNFYKNIII